MELKLASVKQLSELLGVDEKWIYDRTSPKARKKALKKGEVVLPYYRLGKYVRFKISEVETWIENFRE